MMEIRKDKFPTFVAPWVKSCAAGKNHSLLFFGYNNCGFSLAAMSGTLMDAINQLRDL